MDVTIRQERPGDLPIIQDLVEKAFVDVAESDHLEQCLVGRLHHSGTFVPELSLVAEDGAGTIVGYILLTRVKIVSKEGSKTTLAVAPLAVAPACQRQQVGGRLLREAHRIAASLGYKSAVLLGHADYYPRFGYRMASDYGIAFPFEAPQECCMAIELQPEGLSGVKGTVRYPKCFFEDA